MQTYKFHAIEKKTTLSFQNYLRHWQAESVSLLLRQLLVLGGSSPCYWFPKLPACSATGHVNAISCVERPSSNPPSASLACCDLPSPSCQGQSSPDVNSRDELLIPISTFSLQALGAQSSSLTLSVIEQLALPALLAPTAAALACCHQRGSIVAAVLSLAVPACGWCG